MRLSDQILNLVRGESFSKKTIIREIEFQSTENQLCNALELPDVELIAVDRIDRSILDLIAPAFKKPLLGALQNSR